VERCGRYADAAAILRTRVFHPWEGGEGKVTGQYLLNQLHRALQHRAPAFTQAIHCLKEALRYPDNLGEGDCRGRRTTISGICWAIARTSWGCAAGDGILPACPPGGSTLDAGRYYNDQPADYLFWQGMALRKSGNEAQAEQHFQNFIAWARQHRDDVPQADFLPSLYRIWWSSMFQRSSKHQQHCLFIEALGHLGLGNVSASQQAMQQLLQSIRLMIRRI
jgi:tetratricopeptide (TPR) repeat protein